jgi:hypothetical protein
MNKQGHPNAAQLRQLLDYDPLTGKLYWRARPVEMFKAGKHTREHNARTWNSRYAGTEAFASKNGHGYYQGSIFKRKYEAHRVIWALVYDEWPETVDHQDGDIENNRIVNLLGKPRADNQKNLGLRKDNKSGFAGVTETPGGKWRAQIQVNGTGRTLGYFETKLDAIRARKLEEAKHGFHVNHGARQSTAARRARAAA